MTNYDRNIPTEPQKRQWMWVAITLASIALAVITAVM